MRPASRDRCRSRTPSGGSPCSGDRRGERRGRCGRRRRGRAASPARPTGIPWESRTRRRRMGRTRSGSGTGPSPSRSGPGTSSILRARTAKASTSDGAPPGTTASRGSRRTPTPAGASPTRAPGSRPDGTGSSRTTVRTTRSPSSRMRPIRRDGRTDGGSPTSRGPRKSPVTGSLPLVPAGGPDRSRTRGGRPVVPGLPDRSRSIRGPSTGPTPSPGWRALRPK